MCVGEGGRGVEFKLFFLLRIHIENKKKKFGGELGRGGMGRGMGGAGVNEFFFCESKFKICFFSVGRGGRGGGLE